MAVGQREGDALVLADRAAEDHPALRVLGGATQRDPADAQCLSRDQDPLGVEAVEDVAETLALLTDATVDRHAQPVVADLARHHGVAAHLGDRGDVDRRVLQVDQQQGHALGRAVAQLLGRGAHQQQAHVAVGGLGGPHLGSGDHVLIAVALGSGADRGGVGAGVGLGDAEGGVDGAVGNARQDLLGQRFRAVLAHRFHAEDRQVQGRAAVHGRTAGSHLLQHDRRLGDALTSAAVLGWNGDADPAAFRHCVVEIPGELVLLVALAPVLVGEVCTDAPHALADRLVVLVLGEVHRADATGRPLPDSVDAAFAVLETGGLAAGVRGDDLGHDRHGRFFGRAAADVEADRGHDPF